MSAKKATTIEEQIALLKSRGMNIRDDVKAKEILSDIGYFRLGFYFFPFEKSYPRLTCRTHEYKAGSYFEDAVALYYFDYDLRNMLSRYITRIEIALRTYIVLFMSCKYKDTPAWFVNPRIVDAAYVRSFDGVYENIKKNPVIRRHHRKYPEDRYASAWKTVEYMTLGSVLKLYQSLAILEDKRDISRHFGINQTAVFESYMETVRFLRNTCAHGGVLWDLAIPKRIGNGPAGRFSGREMHNLFGAIAVVKYLLGQISVHRLEDMEKELDTVFQRIMAKAPKLSAILRERTGFAVVA